MKAVAITPRQARTAFMVDPPALNFDEVPNGKGVLVKASKLGQRLALGRRFSNARLTITYTAAKWVYSRVNNPA